MGHIVARVGHQNVGRLPIASSGNRAPDGQSARTSKPLRISLNVEVSERKRPAARTRIVVQVPAALHHATIRMVCSLQKYDRSRAPAHVRPLWKLSDLKQMHCGQSTLQEQIILDPEQNATYNSGAPGTKYTAHKRFGSAS